MTATGTVALPNPNKLTLPVVSLVRIIGEPTTPNEAATLAEDDKYQFQWWALGLVGARPVEQKKGADHGIDGKFLFRDDTKAASAHQRADPEQPGFRHRPDQCHALHGQHPAGHSVLDLRFAVTFLIRKRNRNEFGVAN